MNTVTFDDAPIVWQPKPEHGVQMREFMKEISGKYGVKIDDYWDLHKWSTDNTAVFWEEIWNISDIIYSREYNEVVDLTVPMADRPEWFVGARLNYAENLLKYRDDHVAMILAGEDKKPERVTYAEMYIQVELYAAAFRRLGLKKNDTVVCYMSNRAEAVYAMIAATSIGAIFTGALPMMGAKAVLNRFKQVRPKVFLTVDKFLYNGRRNEMIPKVTEVANGLPTLEKVIVVSSLDIEKREDISGITNSCHLEEFLSLGRNADGTVPPMVFEQVPLSHPVFICYTSGTTGLPKPIVHGAGCLLSVVRDTHLHRSIVRELITLSVSPVGWASWNMFCTFFFVGSGLLLYDGVPFFHDRDYLWDLIEETGVTSVFLAPSILDEMERRNLVPSARHHLTSITSIFSGGSVVKPQNYDFVYNKIKKNVIFSSGYGSTEVMGSSLITESSLPVRRGEITCPALGMDVHILNENGDSVIGEIGEFSIAKPIPMMALGLWDDKDGSIFKSTYYSKYTDKFLPGDVGVINPKTRGVLIYGRSDETLKPRGCRYGSSEIYNVVDLFPEIQDSIVVSQYSPRRNERAVLFIKMKEGHDFDESLDKRIRTAIQNELTPRHVPDLIFETKAIPYNMNAKKMEILVKKIINGMPYNSETVINKESLVNYLNVPPYED